jgi:rifampin ADP-ribosyltransferase
MAAQDNLNPAQFFHGTIANIPVGSDIKPGKKIGRTEGGWETNQHTFATPDMGNAADYGVTGSEYSNPPGQPVHVYQVEPKGKFHTDPWDESAIRSKSNMKVVREVPESEWKPAHQSYLGNS